MRAAVFDLESTALEAVGAGILLCGVVRQVPAGISTTFRYDDYKFKSDPAFGEFERQERQLVIDLVAELSKYDLLIGHNCDRFDLGYLHSRAQALGVPFSLMPLTYDTMKGFNRTQFRTVLNFKGKPSASLDMIADFFGISQEKTKLYPREHWLTLWGNAETRKEATDKLVDHCVRDVRMTAKVYECVLPADMRVTIRRWM